MAGGPRARDLNTLAEARDPFAWEQSPVCGVDPDLLLWELARFSCFSHIRGSPQYALWYIFRAFAISPPAFADHESEDSNAVVAASSRTRITPSSTHRPRPGHFAYLLSWLLAALPIPWPGPAGVGGKNMASEKGLGWAASPKAEGLKGSPRSPHYSRGADGTGRRGPRRPQ